MEKWQNYAKNVRFDVKINIFVKKIEILICQFYYFAINRQLKRTKKNKKQPKKTKKRPKNTKKRLKIHKKYNHTGLN